MMDSKLFFSGLFKLYFYWEVLVITSIFVVLINSLYSIISKKVFNYFDLRITLFTLIFNHMFFIIGFFIFILNLILNYWDSNHQSVIDQSYYLFDFNPNLLNLLSTVFITVGWSLHKKSLNNLKRFLRIFIFYFLGLLILVVKSICLN
jgi:hypothetical protein